MSTTQATPAVIRPVTPGDISLGRYGIIGQGNETNDTAAFHDACQDVFDAGGGIVKVPPGRFLIGSPFVSTQDIGSPDGNGVVIEGVSPVNTIFETKTGLFSWTQTNRNVSAEFRNFGMHMATDGNNGTLINVTQPSGGLASNSRCKATNLTARAADAVYNTGYADKVIDFSNTYFPHIEECNFTQPRGSGIPDSVTQSGTCLIDVEDTYGPRVLYCRLWGSPYGIYHNRSTGVGELGGEGGRFNFNEIVHNTISIYSNGGGGQEPGFIAFSNHINAYTYGIHAVNLRLVMIRDSHPYNVTTNPYIDFYLQNCDVSHITGNQFHYGGNTNRVNIQVDSNCNLTNIADNIHNCAGKGHVFENGSGDIYLSGPMKNNELNTLIDDQGASNLNTIHKQKLVLKWKLSEAEQVATDSDVVLDWDVEAENTYNFGSPGQQIQVPSGLGITTAKIEIGLTWENNSTGVRSVRLTKNNTSPDDVVDETRNAAFLSNSTINGEMAVTEGDVLRVIVRQSSGATLDLSYPETFIRVTFS